MQLSVEICSLEGINYGKEVLLSAPLLAQRIAAIAAAVGNAFSTDQPKVVNPSIIYARVTTDTNCLIAFGTTPNAALTVPSDASTTGIQLIAGVPLIIRVLPAWKFVTA